MRVYFGPQCTAAVAMIDEVFPQGLRVALAKLRGIQGQ
jgi:hypothetical protein